MGRGREGAEWNGWTREMGSVAVDWGVRRGGRVPREELSFSESVLDRFFLDGKLGKLRLGLGNANMT